MKEKKKKTRKSHWCKALEDGAKRTRSRGPRVSRSGHTVSGLTPAHSVTLGKTSSPTCAARRMDYLVFLSPVGSDTVDLNCTAILSSPCSICCICNFIGAIDVLNTFSYSNSSEAAQAASKW